MRIVSSASCFLFVLALGTFTFAPLTPDAQAQTVNAPVAPREYLKVLPPAPQGWKILQSTAAHTTANPPSSEAKRIYAFYDPAQTQTAESRPLRTVTLTISDTRGNEDITQVYVESEPDQPGMTRRGDWFNIGSVRAVRVKVEGQADHVELLLQKRFLLTYIVKDAATTPASATSPTQAGPATSLPPEKIEQWLGMMNLQPLAQAASGAGTLDVSKDFVFKVEKIDELNPKRNAVIEVHMGGANPQPES